MYIGSHVRGDSDGYFLWVVYSLIKLSYYAIPLQTYDTVKSAKIGYALELELKLNIK